MTLPLARQATDTAAIRRVDGQVVRGTRRDPVPVGNDWVVLHRVGPDRSGPLDSVRTDAAGRFHFRYKLSGDPSALYFVSTSYGGVAYLSSVLRAPVVSGDDGLITVFDTTSGPVAVILGGRHVIVGAPQANGRRPIGEVYDIKNDTTVTVVARDTLTPVWTTHLPPRAVGFQLNENGELASGAIAQRGNVVGLFAPISPGIRQLAYTYELPSDAFPLSLPLERQTGVLELLVQEPSAKVSGVTLREMAPVSAEGRLFRRFLGSDVPANAVLTIDLPRIIGPERQKVYMGIGIAMVLAMTIALFFAARRPLRGRRTIAPPPPQSRADLLLREITALDAAFERLPAPDADARRSHEARRTALKAELAALLEPTRSAP